MYANIKSPKELGGDQRKSSRETHATCFLAFLKVEFSQGERVMHFQGREAPRGQEQELNADVMGTS
jgi:hypothetical protein